MSATPFTAAQLNTWMHEHHADTVADLAQRGLAMEFIDAQAGRPTSLRVFSEKVPFGFQLPVPYSFQSFQHMEPMMVKSCAAAPGFQQAINVFGNSKAFMSPLIIEDWRGWQLHMRPQERWEEDFLRWGEATVSRLNGDGTVDKAITNLVAETDAIEAMGSIIDFHEIINDPVKSTLRTESKVFPSAPANACEFNLAPIGAETANYTICLFGRINSYGEPELAALTSIKYLDRSFNGPQILRPEMRFAIMKDEHPAFFQGDESKKITASILEPEAFGITKEALSILIQLGLPLSQELPRFKQATIESYDFDFSMDDQASSGLSL